MTKALCIQDSESFHTKLIMIIFNVLKSGANFAIFLNIVL